MIIRRDKIDFEYKNIYELTSFEIGIPIFQRFYDWKENEVKQLIEDIDDLIHTKGDLYFLDFIYYVENGRIKLADGQQRLVTINILIKAINNYIITKKLKKALLNQFNVIYDIDEYDKKFKDLNVGEIKAPFQKVYTVFDNKIATDWNKNIDKLIDIVSNKIYIYMKKCSNVDDAYQIFQQINTGGKPLTKDEIIKTALMQYGKTFGINIKYDGDIKQPIISYYKFKEDNPSGNFDNMTIMTFMKTYITKSKETFMEFKNNIDRINNNHDSPICTVIKYLNRQVIFDVINILSYKNIKIDEKREYLDDIIIPLCMASIVLTLNDASPTNYRYFIQEIIPMVKNDEKPSRIKSKIISYINDHVAFKISSKDLALKINTRASLNMKKAIYILDAINCNKSGKLIVKNVNIEHIYPKDHSKWDEYGWPTNNDECNECINHIGNLFLLSETVNKSIQNQYITGKIEKYLKIIKKDKLLQTPLNTVDFDKFMDVTSARKYMEVRKQLIIDTLKNEMPIGKVVIQ